MALFVSIFSSVLFLPILGQANESIVAQGRKLQVQNIEYYVGSKDVANFELLQDEVFEFAEGSQFIASGGLYLHRNTNISLLFSNNNKLIELKTSDPASYLLSCGPHPATMLEPARPRLIQFHDNRVYKGGCELAQNRIYRNAFVDLQLAKSEVGKSSAIDLAANFSLTYAGHISLGEISLNKQKLKLQPGSSVALFESGAPRFFTLSPGEKFSTNQSIYGLMKWLQDDRKISTSLFEGGEVERAILAQDFELPELQLRIPAGSGLAFSAPDQLDGILWKDTQTFTSSRIQFKYDQSYIVWNETRMELRVAESFVFKKSAFESINIPSGSIVDVSFQDELLSIRVPRRGEP